MGGRVRFQGLLDPGRRLSLPRGLVGVTFSIDTLLPMKGKGLTLAIDFPRLLIREGSPRLIH